MNPARNILLALAMFAALSADAAYRKGELLWKCDFTPEEAAKYGVDGHRGGGIVYLPTDGRSGDGAMFFKSQSEKQSAMVTIQPDVKLVGIVQIEADVKGVDVGPGPQHFTGPKVMFPFVPKSGAKTTYPQLERELGTFDWKTPFRVLDIPETAEQFSFVLGLQSAPGEFWVDSVRVYRAEEAPDEEVVPPVNEAAKRIPRGPYAEMPRRGGFRGTMSGGDMDEASVANLADAWGANLLRLQIHAARNAETIDEWFAGLERKLDWAQEVADRCGRHGMKVILDLHGGPNCKATKHAANVVPADYDSADLRRAWRMIATRFKDHPAVYAYDILNEPSTAPETWRRVSLEVMADVRKIDPRTPFMIESIAHWYEGENVIYSPHFYSPHSLTHFGVGGPGKVRWSYPGYIDGVYWDRERMRVDLKPWIDFQRAHPDARICVGEFSCILWSKGADRWIRDAISVFEEYGWDWCYHAYREWPPWSVEFDHDADYMVGKFVPSDDNPRKRALLEGLSRNKAGTAADGGLSDLYAGEVRFAEDGRERPAISNGTFRLGGRPVFFLGPWIYNHTKEDWPPENPDPQGVGHVAYRELPGKDVFERVGFNASQLSSAWALPGQALYGLDAGDGWQKAEAEKEAFFARFGDQPMVADFAFGFVGALKKQLPELWKQIEQKNPHWHEFVPVCPEAPEGDAYYRAYLKGGTVSALRGGANVFLWELFNESSYQCRCPSNAVAFAKEMETAFGAIGEANRAWGTDYADFAAVARETDFFRHPRLWPDYAKFLARRYAAILRDYADFVRSIDGRGNVYFTEQSSVSSIEKERNSCMDYRLVADALDVLAHEGGFRYGRGGSELKSANAMEDVVFGSSAGHFLDMDFYQALARDEKPIVNDELYCQRIELGRRVPSRREDLATSHWAEVFHGTSGAFSYCWAKRAWEWKDMDGARRMVEKPSYKSAHLLNPYAWPPEELAGFRQFMEELEPFRDRILDFPRTRSVAAPSVAVVFSYPTVRMLGHVRMDYRERLQRWYGAVLGAHYPLKIVFEEDLPAGLPPSVRALVVPSARFATPEGAAAASRLAESGLTVVADRDAFCRDERGDPLPEPSAKIVRLDADSDASIAPLLIALAASGARHDATLALNATGLPPRGSDIQIIDRGDFKLLYFVAFGEDATRGGVLRWNVADGGEFYLSDPIHKRLLLDGAKETWNAAALSNGVFVAVPPQERALFVLSREPPEGGYARVDRPAMQALLAEARASEAPALADYAQRAAEEAARHEDARTWRDVDASRCTPIPIAGSANMAFADDVAGDRRGGWFDQGSNDFASMPVGRHVLAGVPFEIADPAANGGRAAIVLYGTNRDFFPERAPEIPVGLKAKRLYFLHACGWDAPEGTPVLTYRVRYADGEIVDFVCRAKKEIGPWHGARVPSDAKLAVESSNAALGRVNVQCARWTNPRPDIEILSIEPVSARSPAVPAIVAITAEK